MATSSVGKPIVLDSKGSERFRKAMKVRPKKLHVTNKTIVKVHPKHSSNH